LAPLFLIERARMTVLSETDLIPINPISRLGTTKVNGSENVG